ncbi:MAG: alpha/beta fold hydrolase [Anaerolineales bacterium]
MPKIPLPDFTMAFDDVGSGKAILFIHGYPLTRKMWQPQLDGLSSSVRVIAPDLRGHGESTPTKGVYSMDLLARDCHYLIDHLNIEKVYLCGLSMGGYISLAFARIFPQHLAGLILTATRASADSEEGKINRERAIESAQKNGIIPIIETMIPRLLSPYTFQHQPQLADELRQIMQNVTLDAVIGDLSGMKARPDSRAYLHEINVPTLIIHGKDDQLIPVAEVQEMSSAIPHSQLVLLDHCGHLPNLEAKDLFNQIILNFVNQN